MYDKETGNSLEITPELKAKAQAAYNSNPDRYKLETEEELSPKVPTKSSKAIASNLRYTAKEIQDEYDRTNVKFPGDIITDPTQGIAGDIYDVAS